jgi:hypothetical protein
MAMCEFTVLGEWMTAGEITRAAASIVASRRRDSFISPKRECAEGEPGFSDCALKVENVTRTGRCTFLFTRGGESLSSGNLFTYKSYVLNLQVERRARFPS